MSEVTKEAVERVGFCASGEWRIVPGKDCPECGATQRDECRPARLAEFAELVKLRAENRALLTERDAALAAAQAARKRLTALCEILEEDGDVQGCIGSMAPAEHEVGLARAFLALSTPPGEKA